MVDNKFIPVEKKTYYKTIAKTCYTANIVYLVLHVFYLVLFLIAKFNIVAYVTIGVIVTDLLFFILLKKKKYYLYALCCGNQFFIFISVATIMTGFANGFHFYLIGLCVVSFFTTYFSKSKNMKGTIIWVILSIIIYLVLFFVCEFNAPFYATPKWLEMTLFTTHAIMVFVFIAAYLMVFIKYALSLENKIMNESRTDELTQISNRYGLYDYFEYEEDKSSLLLALFDIDDFKIINDKYGHVTGDYILKKVAEMTSNILNDSFVCRFGGEEFVVVLKENKDASFFERLEVLRTKIYEEPFEFEGKKINITMTIGGVCYIDGLSLDKWVELADKKMYRGKRNGKNQTVI